MPIASEHPVQVADQLLARNRLFERFFEREALRLAHACREMSERFLRGGRLIAFGRGPYATDAQHVSVEFVHPVIVGKRALPALDLSLDFGPWLDALVAARRHGHGLRRRPTAIPRWRRPSRRAAGAGRHDLRAARARRATMRSTG